MKSLTAFSSNMPIIFFFIHFGICVKQKFSIIPNVTSFCLIHGIINLQERCLFEKILEMNCKESDMSIDTVLFHVFQHGYDNTETSYCRHFPMWLNDYGSKCPTVSVRWQNKKKELSKILGYRHSSTRRKVAILYWILRSCGKKSNFQLSLVNKWYFKVIWQLIITLYEIEFYTPCCLKQCNYQQ